MPVMEKDRKHGKPNGPMVEFYLGRTIRGQQVGDKPQVVPINVNGYKYEAVMGQRNRLPKEVVEVLQNAKSQTRVVDVEEAERMPRKQGRFQDAPTRLEYASDYELDIIKEGD